MANSALNSVKLWVRGSAKKITAWIRYSRK